MNGRILVVEDDPALTDWLRTALGKRGFTVTARASVAEALSLLASEDFEVVVTDLNLPGDNGIALAERLAGDRPDTPVVVITAFGSMETAIAAIRAGAYDFITKPFEVEALRLTLERAITHRSLRQEIKRLRRALEPEHSFEGMVGGGAVMRRLYDLIARIADTDSSVLITGETGTGKELVAQAIHQRSRRKNGPLVAVNCAAISPQLLESELFGHAKGAFTDAVSRRPGLFAQAKGGTLLLDEIGELPLDLQPKLLRALEQRTIRPVGSDEEVAVDVRVIAATHRDLELAVEESRFREDLYYRINVLYVPIPPLRERGSDVLSLAQHFVEKHAKAQGRSVLGIAPEAAQKLVNYAWPGNVRELANCLERAVALTRFDRIVVEDLPEKVSNYRPSRMVLSGESPSEVLPLEEIERRYILWAVEVLGGNRTQASERLGVDRKTLYRKLARYEATRKG